MLDKLDEALNETGIPFVFAGWSKAPEDEYGKRPDYGVYSLSGQEQFRADSDSGAEIMIRGFVDLFTHDRTRASQNLIENKLRGLGLWWTLESIQFEPENGYLHYEWSWADIENRTEGAIK